MCVFDQDSGNIPGACRSQLASLGESTATSGARESSGKHAVAVDWTVSRIDCLLAKNPKKHLTTVQFQIGELKVSAFAATL